MKNFFIKLKIFTKNNKGEGYIETIIAMAIIMSLIFCFIEIPPLYVKKQNIDYMANSLARAVETTGEINSDIMALMNQYKSELGINPTIDWEGNFFGPTNKIQIRDKFTVTVSDTVTIKIADPSFSAPLLITIPVSKRVKGVSEVYWKP